MRQNLNECRLLSVSSILGYGFPEASLKAGLEREPHFIGVDGGSTDPGAYYLGSGECLNSRKATKRDLRLMLLGAVPRKIPVVIGTCGGAGGEPHLQAVAVLAREIAREEGLKFRMALIHAEQDRDAVKLWLRQGRIQALRNVPEITEAVVERTTRIVGMMGAEPFMRALEDGADVVLAGRGSRACADLEAEDALAAIESARAGAARFLPGVDVERMVRAYEEILLRNGKIDFQDLVPRAPRGMEQGRIAPLAAAHLLVDEFQDTDETQLAWVLAHARAGAAVTAGGDDEQSIYGWRRALGHQGRERFAQERHARRIDLGINYRSRREIVQQAAILIARNRGRARQNKSRAGAAVLTTMHGAKGLEWDCVWIVGAEETVTPDGKAPLEEERRLFYVAMTRAREALVISRTNRNPPSRFLSELGLAF